MLVLLFAFVLENIDIYDFTLTVRQTHNWKSESNEIYSEKMQMYFFQSKN